jgi:hypothetical protein
MSPVKIAEIRRREKWRIRLMCMAEDRCVLVRRGKRIYQFQITPDGSHLHIVGEPPKKIAHHLERHLAVIAEALKIKRKFLRKGVEAWASEPGVFQDLHIEIPA